MKVLIVGAGIGGLALAGFLKETGVEYDQIEKCTDWNRQGYLIALWDNGRDILRKLGLAEQFDAVGSRVQRYSVRDGSGNIIRDYVLNKFYSSYGGAITMVDRNDLHELLLQNAGPVRMDCSVETIMEKGERLAVTFTDGRTETYDFVIGADGIHSKVRGLVFRGNYERYINWRSWFVWIDHSYDVPATLVEYVEPRALIVTGTAGKKTLANFIAPVDHSVWDTTEGRVERLKELFKNESHIVPAAFDHIRDEDLMPTDLIDLSMRHWFHGRAVLLGDAAHSFGPLAGMGGSMALEDAYVLVASLIRIRDGAPIKQTLRAYERKRKKRIVIVKRLTNKVQHGVFVRSVLLRRIINRYMRTVSERVLTDDYEELLKHEM